MRLTKKNSQKRQNYYRHNKKSQKRHMKGGGGAPPVPQRPRPTKSTKLPTPDNVKDLNTVSGNSRNLHQKTKEDKVLGSGNFGTVQKRCENVKKQSNCYAVKTLIIKKKVDDAAYKKLLEDLTREVNIQRELTMNGENQIGDKNYIAQYISHSIITAANSSKPIVPYLAMKIYDKSLDSLNYEKDENFFTDNSIKKFIKQLCEGLKYMNKKNISHNDIAARNVLIAKVGEEYQPRITDFGLAQEIPNGNSTEIQYKIYPVLDCAPEIFERRKIYKKSDVYSAAILLSNIIFNYHLFRYKGKYYEWKNLLKQAPFNKYPEPFNISNIKKMYGFIGKGQSPNLYNRGQPYVDLINYRYLNKDYSNNSIIAIIFEKNTFRKAKCFRYDVTQRSNMKQLCKLFNNKIPELDYDVFDYLKDQSYVDKAISFDVPEAEAAAKAKAEAEEKARAAGAEAEAEAGAGAGAEAEEAQPTESKAKAEAAEAAAQRPRLIASESTHETLGGVLGENEATQKRAEAEARAKAEAEAEAEAEGEKTVDNLITLMVNKNNHTKFPEIFNKFNKIKNKSTQINKKKYKKYEKSYTGLGGIKKLRIYRLKKILSNLQELNNNNNNNAARSYTSSAAGGARTNKKKFNKKYSKKSKKNYTINKKRTHKRK